MKIIFLDFDGVIRLPPADPPGGDWLISPGSAFCPERMRRLRWACGATGARIVVSSDWRNVDNRAEIAASLSPWLDQYLHADWSTPICGHRHNEVDRWLSTHPGVTGYAILEDFRPHFDGASPEMLSRVLWTNNRHGIVPETIDRLVKLLGPAG